MLGLFKKWLGIEKETGNQMPKYSLKEYRENLYGLKIVAETASTPEARAEAQAILDLLQKVFDLGYEEGRSFEAKVSSKGRG